jgi:hypothetical protein
LTKSLLARQITINDERLLEDGARLEQHARVLGGGLRAEVAVRVHLADSFLERLVDRRLGGGKGLQAEHRERRDDGLLRAQLPLSLLLAWAIETKKYRLDDEVMHGKYGGAVLDPARTNAMLQLAFSASEGAPARESVPLIEKVLYGAEQEHPRDNGRGMGDGLRDIPSTYDLVNMTLKEAKSLTKVLREQSGTVPTEHTAEHGGHAVIVDLFSSAASADAAEALEKVR